MSARKRAASAAASISSGVFGPGLNHATSLANGFIASSVELSVLPGAESHLVSARVDHGELANAVVHVPGLDEPAARLGIGRDPHPLPLRGERVGVLDPHEAS